MMKTRRTTIIVVFAALLFGVAIISGCAKTKSEDHKSGRLNYVETLKYGPAEVHGQEGWYVTDRNFYVNDRRWLPDNIKVKDIARCEPSPNSSVEVLRCYSF